MWKLRTPAEIAHFVPEPTIILFGCRPLVPFHRGWHDRPSHDQHYHAPESIGVDGDQLWPTRRCPACKGKIGRRNAGRRHTPFAAFFAEIDHRTYCELCGSMDPTNEANALAQRIEQEALGRHIETARHVDRILKNGTDKAKRRPRLSEADRRRIWNGYKGGIVAANLDVTNRAKIGREFLTRIKQEPDWTLILDRTGRVIGRVTM